MLRFIRINSVKPEEFVVTKPGTHNTLQKYVSTPKQDTPSSVDLAEDQAMDDDDVPLLREPLERFSSTIMAMDEI